jgi:predicted CXXCH cytochrome family protein
LLDDPLYYADGQIRDEVYEYGSFLQSRMHAAGVACTDCHDPHSGGLRAEGNALCAKCHQAAVFDTPAHHHHPAGTAGARCVACHMPARTYMVVDQRRDHSFRVPRPDLSTAIGTPNTCTDCHRDRSAAWAADALRTWGVSPSVHSFRYAEALASGRRQEDSAGPALTAVIADPAMPALVRATALTLLTPYLDPRSAALVEHALQDPDPLVRRAALTLLPAWPPQERWQRGAAAVRDPVRTVRLEAVDALAAPPGSVPMSAEERAAFERAVAEYRDVQRLNADRPESGLNLGALDARLGNTEQAEKEYRDVLQRQPNFVPVLVNLADLYRQTHRDADAEPLLRQAVTTAPQNGDVHYALGLLFVRQRRVAEATGELGSAAALRPDNPHYAYAHALALDAAGRSGEAIERLEQAQTRFPRDREILEALVDLNARAGHADAARRWQGELRQSAAGSGTAP